jgi:hypothetical protein
MMDRLQRSYFQLMAKNDYLEKKRQVFQDWIGRLLKLAWKGDYEDIRLTQGDGGLDGIVISQSAVVAVFAPREFTQAELKAKLTSDFGSAKKTLADRSVELKKMIFIHNDEGVPKDIGATILSLRQGTPDITIEVWTFASLWHLMETSLSYDELQDFLGEAPTTLMLERLEMPAIREVIEYLMGVQTDPRLDTEITIPDQDKLQYNRLSETNEHLLRCGRSKHALVVKFLEGMTDLRVGEAIAEGFRRKYAACVSSGMQPDDTFATLWDFAGGNHFTTPPHLAAVTAVLSHFFHTCDIFKNIPVTP